MPQMAEAQCEKRAEGRGTPFIPRKIGSYNELPQDGRHVGTPADESPVALLLALA